MVSSPWGHRESNSTELTCIPNLMSICTQRGRRKSSPLCLSAYLLFCLFWFWEELFELNEEPLRTPPSHFTDEKAEAQRGTVTWPKAHSEHGGSILCQPSKTGAAFPRIPSPSWLWVGGSHREICMRSGGWKCNSSHYCDSGCVRSQAMLQPPHLLAHLAALGQPARPVQLRLHWISSFSFPELWARFVCNVMMKPASSAGHPYHPLEGWRQQEITRVPVTDRCGSQCSAWWVLSYPSRFYFVLAHFLFLPSSLPDCQPYRPPDTCVQTNITAHQLP